MRTFVLVLAACGLAGCASADEPATAPAPAPGPVTRPAMPAPSLPPPPGSQPPVVAPAAPKVGPVHPAAPRVEDVAAVVEHLLARIEGSGLTFIRNGREHSAAKAAAHIRDKYEHFKDEIATAEEFIDKAATKSELSGRPYLVKRPDGTTRRAADWLRERLAEYRAEQAGA